jgi:hypothetical protein
VEFNVETGMPSCIERIIFSSERKISFQQIIINTRASAPAYIGLAKAEAIAMIKDNDRYSLQALIQKYEYDDNRIVGADCIGIAPGSGKYKYKKIYSYDETGRLEEITNVLPGGIRQLSYVRIEEGQDADTISERLAARIAGSVVDTLLINKVETPIAIVELGYRYVTGYFPVVISRSESLKKKVIDDGGEDIWQGLFSGFYELLHPDKSDFEKLFVQFMQIIQATEDYEMGRIMLRKTAALLTRSKLLGRIPVSDEFVTYAIDNHGEGLEKEEFKDILKDCGLEEDIVEAWDDRGWLRP